MNLRHWFPRIRWWAAVGVMTMGLFALAAAQASAPAKPNPAAPSPAAQQTTPAQAAQNEEQTFALPPLPPGSAARGRALFTGRARFQNGGPACADCHTIAGLGFPGGGTLAPDLTGDYQRLGPVGMRFVLQTLYFPAMQPVYHRHLLTPGEQAGLMAFFAAAPAKTAQRSPTGYIVGIAVVGCLCLFLLTGYLWRDRVRGVRRPMVEQARAAARRARAAGQAQGAMTNSIDPGPAPPGAAGPGEAS